MNVVYYYCHLEGMIAYNLRTCGCIFNLLREIFCLMKTHVCHTICFIMFRFKCVGEGGGRGWGGGH